MSEKKASWIAADWGTSNLRVWALDESGEPIAHRGSDKGMGKLERQAFEPALLELIDDLLADGVRTQVIICGMAGARQGWVEAPYNTVPCPPPSLNEATAAPATDPRLDVHILPGLKQDDPADVMRGEETQIAGFLSGEPEFEGLLCLPGTHTKWASISGGKILRFKTVMTGELFALLSTQSVLRHGLAGEEFDEEGFRIAVGDAYRNPASVIAELFGIRSAGLVADLAPETARARLSGLLLGAELAAMRQNISDLPVAILGSSGVALSYKTALESIGTRTRMLDADTITLHGLKLAYASRKKVTS
ncbi:2-dehydro-3-deoxygalactonokinase [Rhodobacterales bacterium]|nr:2-dehydro-3-deoxygalactonokinase [Rhodobacterales bacterium]